MNLFARAFSQAEQSLYRLDALDEGPSFHLLPSERIVFFHFRRLNQDALMFDRGNEVVHLIGTGVKYIDESGRYPNEARGSRIFPSPEFWISGG